MNLKTNGKSIALWVIIGLFIVALFNIYHSSLKKEVNFIPLSDFITEVNKGHIKEVEMREQDITGISTYGVTFSTYAPFTYDIIPLLLEKNVRFTPRPKEQPYFTFWGLFQMIFPMVVFAAIWYFIFFRHMQSSNGRAMGFGRSRAKLSDPEKNPITFDDVEGVVEAKEDLKEIVEFLKDPHRFQKIGGRIPRGVLLVGPPGTGKTLLARAIAGEARVPFFSISGSDFVEMFVGVGASRVRDLFSQAKQHAPCIIFIDEIDAVGRHRGGGVGAGGGNDEREQTLNQLLVEMDGFDVKEEVIVMAATNRADVLDSALLRPGRFDRQIFVSLPDLKGRESILKLHMKKIRVASDVSPTIIARGTPGFSGADLENLVNEAALLAGRQHKKMATMEDFEHSRDKLMMGPERRSWVIEETEKKLTAYHEAGHAVVAYHSPASDPIHKATIIPRGSILGMVMRLPETDQVSMPKKRILADMAVAMGGRAAEAIIFGEDNITSGASADLRGATSKARAMVIEWGMSDTIGPVSYADSLSRQFYHPKEVSETIMETIDTEVKKILDAAYETAHSILTKNLRDLHLIAQYLLEQETLTGEEIHTLLTEGTLAAPAAEKVKRRKTAAPKPEGVESAPGSGVTSKLEESLSSGGVPKLERTLQTTAPSQAALKPASRALSSEGSPQSKRTSQSPVPSHPRAASKPNIKSKRASKPASKSSGALQSQASPRAKDASKSTPKPEKGAGPHTVEG